MHGKQLGFARKTTRTDPCRKKVIHTNFSVNTNMKLFLKTTLSLRTFCEQEEKRLNSSDTLFTISNLTTSASKTVVWNCYLYSVECIAKTSFSLSAVSS